MNTLLVLKLVLVPTLIAGVTLAGRRWGAGIAGWLGGFPVVSAPILLFLALEQGDEFAAQAAAGTLSAVLAVLAFGIGYARTAARRTWPASLAASFACYGVGVAAIAVWPLPLQISAPAVLCALLLAPLAYPEPDRIAGDPPAPVNDLAVRMGAAAILVFIVTQFASKLGPNLSGVFAMFPVLACVLAVFSHRHQGAAFAVRLLRGMVPGYYAFATFCAVLAMALPATDRVTGFVLALGVAMLVQLLTRRTVRGAGGRAAVLDEAAETRV